MATSELSEEPAQEINKERSFKGHPQPPLRERLQQARNFLADEDSNRNIEFREKLAEIEEYIKYIEDEELIKKPGHGATDGVRHLYRLYHDVRTKADIHRDWDNRVRAGPSDTVCCDAPSVMPVSTRLVSLEQTALIGEERNALGVESLMREDHPPFTVTRQGDEFEFLRAMQDAAVEDPDTLDKNTNLVWVEGRAFERAMREPALIPYWLNGKNGLPKKGVKPKDSEPWYVLYGKGQKPYNGPGRPLPMEDLPEWLERRQKKTNQLLSMGKRRTEEQSKILDDLLHDLEPEWLCKLHDEYHAEGLRLQSKHMEGSDQTADWEKDDPKGKYLLAKKKYRKAAEKWREEFRKQGTQFMVEDIDPEVPKFAAPGVFYFPDENTGDNDFKTRLQKANRAINDVKDDLWKKANTEALQCMIDLLWNHGIFGEKEKSAWTAETKGMKEECEQGVKETLRQLFEAPLRIYLEPYEQFRMLRPGEIDDGLYPKTCFFPWTQSAQGMEDSAARKETTIEAEAAQEGNDASTQVPGMPNATDWRPTAERRGIQRAAIELALSLLCANHEQHRPRDKFRIVQIPGPYITTDLPEIPITLPLESHEQPVELDPFIYTRKVAQQYHAKNDAAYETARQKMIYNYPGAMSPPKNFKGPWVLASVEDKLGFHRDRQSELTGYYELLLSVSKRYPRPIIDAMLERLEEGLQIKKDEDHKFLQHKEGNMVIPATELAELREILADSWDENRQPLSNVREVIPGFGSQKLEELKEFEKNIQDALMAGNLVIPFWEPLENKRQQPEHDQYGQEVFDQTPYNPEAIGKYGLEVTALMEVINATRLSESEPVWAENEVVEFLNALKHMGTIHYNSYIRPRTVSRIPFTGHPENKYVISREAIPESRGVYQITDDEEHNGMYVVQYDATGTIGIPIIQPNKWYHYQQIAFRVGYELALHLQTISDYDDGMMDRWEEHWEAEKGAIGLVKPTEVENITNMAYELHKIAPEIAQEAGLQFEDEGWRLRAENHAAVNVAEEETGATGFQVYPDPDEMHEDQAAVILNIQICEELNNNWESRFPKGEKNWNFAWNRVQPVQMSMNTGRTVGVKPLIKKYFNMRNFPICCQSEERQAAIRASGPLLAEVEQEQVQVEELTKTEKRQEMTASGKRRRKDIYRGAKMAPVFPFGETPYQENFLSWRMEQDLQGVPEFQIRKPRSWIPDIVTRTATAATQKAKEALNPLSYLPKKAPPPQPFPLPKVPADEDTILDSRRSEIEAELDEISKQREETRAKAPGSRKVDPDIKENWYTQEQIVVLNMLEEDERKEELVKEIETAVEKHTKKTYSALTTTERDQAFRDLGINKWAPEKWAGVPKPNANNPTPGPSATMSVSNSNGKRGNSGSLSEEQTPKKAATGMGSKPNSLSKTSVKAKLSSGSKQSSKQATPKIIEVETEEDDSESEGWASGKDDSFSD